MDPSNQDAPLVRRLEPCGKFTPGIRVPDGYAVDTDLLVVPTYYRPLIDKVILSRGQIVDRIEKLAHDIHNYYQQFEEDVVLVCVLKSASMFYAELIRALRTISKYQGDGRKEAYKEHYIKASSYVGQTREDKVLLDQDVGGKKLYKGNHVVVVDDILDSGCTLRALVGSLAETGARSVTSAVLFSKRALWNGVEPEWVGFDLPDEFIVGFGTDLDDHYRDLEHLGIASDLAKRKFGVA